MEAKQVEEKQLMEKFDRLNRRLRRYFDSFFIDLPLTSIQALVLQYVAVESEHRDVFTKDLEEFLCIKGPSVTSLVNNLVRSGYLRRESLEDDGRYKKLILTDKAREIEADIAHRVDSYMTGVFSGISERDRAIFASVIEKMEVNAK